MSSSSLSSFSPALEGLLATGLRLHALIQEAQTAEWACSPSRVRMNALDGSGDAVEDVAWDLRAMDVRRSARAAERWIESTASVLARCETELHDAIEHWSED